LTRAIDVIVAKSNFVILLGGEPTISPNIEFVISRLRDLKANFTLVSNGITLRNPRFRQQLYAAGLRSITVSYDSYKTYSASIFRDLFDIFDDVSVNIIYDRKMVGHLYPLIVDLTSRGIWSIVTSYVYFDDDREHWYFSKSIDEFRILDDKKDDVEREMNTIVERYDNLFVHNDKDYFSSLMEHGLDMSWHCNDWKVLFVNNDLHVQFCQDLPESEYTIFDLDDNLPDMQTAWRNAVSECGGCYINCYFDAEHISEHHERHDKRS
jgi:MoaA/NifB/PqqE/SkfB family radical SAM enzyme